MYFLSTGKCVYNRGGGISGRVQYCIIVLFTRKKVNMSLFNPTSFPGLLSRTGPWGVLSRACAHSAGTLGTRLDLMMSLLFSNLARWYTVKFSLRLKMQHRWAYR